MKNHKYKPNTEKLKDLSLADLLALHTVLEMDNFSTTIGDYDAGLLNFNRKQSVRSEIMRRREDILNLPV